MTARECSGDGKEPGMTALEFTLLAVLVAVLPFAGLGVLFCCAVYGKEPK